MEPTYRLRLCLGSLRKLRAADHHPEAEPCLRLAQR
jgi:hypothetical protein